VRRGAALAGVALSAAVLFNLPAPAGAQLDVCDSLQEAYVTFPDARPQLAQTLERFGCSLPTSSTSSSSTTSSSTTSSSTSTSTSSTTTTTINVQATCATFQQAYLANPGAQSAIILLLQALGCQVPGGDTTTSSSTTTSTSVTLPPNTPGVDVGCASLLAAYNASPTTQSAFLPALLALGCTVPGGNPT